MKKAVVVLSGGLDSTTCMGIAQAEGYELLALTFDYGQRHKIELESARRVAEHYGVTDHRVVKLDFLRDIGGSALTSDHLSVPTDGLTDEIPITYVPGRNLLFLAIASSYAEVMDAEAIFIGVNALDYSGYPDCRPEFIESVQTAIERGTKKGVEGQKTLIQIPLVHWTKAEIIRHGRELKVPYELTTSCYQGAAEACGTCDSCRLRLNGFAEAGYEDPIRYQHEER